MLNNNTIIIDIETIPDEEAIEKSLSHTEFKTYDEYVKDKEKDLPKGKTYFHKPLFHHIVTIGLLFVSTAFNTKYIDFFGKEEDILFNFWKVFGQCQLPTIVTFNGINFDMPVISTRSSKYDSLFEDKNISKIIKRYHNDDDKWEKYGPNYLNRYSKYQTDLFDYFPSKKPSLSEACAIYNIPVKNFGHGSKIKELSDDERRKYCKEDVYATAMLWARLMLKYSNDFMFNDYRKLSNIFLEEMKNGN